MNRESRRVLVVGEHFPPTTTGGTSTYTDQLTSLLPELGWETYLVTQPADGEPAGRWYNRQDIRIYRLKIPPLAAKILGRERIFGLYLLKNLPSLVKSIKPDIIHISGGWYPMFTTRLCAGFKHLPLLWTLHNVPPAEHHLYLFKSRSINRFFETPYLWAVDRLARCSLRLFKYNMIINSNGFNAAKTASIGVPSNKIRIIHYGVDISRFGTSKDKGKTSGTASGPYILSVAGIIEHKGQLNLVKAAPEIIARFPGASFVLVGPVRSPGYLAQINNTITRLKLQSAFTITGGVTDEELPGYYNRCDIYVQPSLEEGFCIAALEAMASGKPVIGTPVGDIPNLVNQSGGGILLSASDPAEIAAASIKLLGNQPLRNSLGQNAREYVVNNYSWEMIARLTSELYHEALSEASG